MVFWVFIGFFGREGVFVGLARVVMRGEVYEGF